MATGTPLKGVKVGSTDYYQFDHDYLANKPTTEIPDASDASGGDVLMISGCSDSHLVWDNLLPTCNTSGFVLAYGNEGLEWVDPSTL